MRVLLCECGYCYEHQSKRHDSPGSRVPNNCAELIAPTNNFAVFTPPLALATASIRVDFPLNAEPITCACDAAA